MLKLTPTASCLCLLLQITIQATGAVRLRATPQKFRTFYSNNNVLIPENILRTLANPSKRARGQGVDWSVEPDALVQAPAEGPTPRSQATGVKRLSFAEGLTPQALTGVRRLS